MENHRVGSDDRSPRNKRILPRAPATGSPSRTAAAPVCRRRVSLIGSPPARLRKEQQNIRGACRRICTTGSCGSETNGRRTGARSRCHIIEEGDQPTENRDGQNGEPERQRAVDGAGCIGVHGYGRGAAPGCAGRGPVAVTPHEPWLPWPPRTCNRWPLVVKLSFLRSLAGYALIGSVTATRSTSTPGRISSRSAGSTPLRWPGSS